MGKLNAVGGGVAFDLMLGGTVADGLVIGGGLLISSANSVRWSGAGSGGSFTGNSGSLSLLGVVIDYYPDPKSGFHVQGALGIGALSFEPNRTHDLPPEKWSGGGGGAMLGVGYEAWVGKQWSLGGVARVLFMSGTLKGDTSDNFDAKGYAPALLFVATHH